MKKIDIHNQKEYTNINKDSDQIKTTNVNILLNRVRLDKKRSLKKKIIISLLFATIISSFTAYLII